MRREEIKMCLWLCLCSLRNYHYIHFHIVKAVSVFLSQYLQHRKYSVTMLILYRKVQFCCHMGTSPLQLCRYGLLLLQATPPQICLRELERRIATVPGVQAVHDLHVWQLAESLMVASVHVHCSARFQAHR